MEKNDPVDSIDQRHFSRVPFDARVEIALYQDVEQPLKLSGKLEDISLKGLLFKIDSSSFEIKTQTNILHRTGQARIILDDQTELLAEIEATHCHERTIGFLIQQMPLETIEHLKRLVSLNLGNSEILDRELHSLIQHNAL